MPNSSKHSSKDPVFGARDLALVTMKSRLAFFLFKIVSLLFSEALVELYEVHEVEETSDRFKKSSLNSSFDLSVCFPSSRLSYLFFGLLYGWPLQPLKFGSKSMFSELSVLPAFPSSPVAPVVDLL